MHLEEALVGVVSFLEEHGIPYMVIGGFANLFWGRSRVTRDVDLTISCPMQRLGAVLTELGRRFRLLPADPLGFARRNRVVPLLVGEVVRVDLVLAGLPYEEEAIRRARVVEVRGRAVRVCSPEDLIIHKIISDRPQDRDDVREIVRRQGNALDRGYMDPIVRELSRALERPDILSFYEECFKEIGQRRP
ncbi:MAG: nucleotidyltransferase [Bacillota bacterium]